jgi:ribosomal protein S18 acetylase RimI-like enzyme
MHDVGTRVMVRYRLPAGSVPPMTDVIGHLVATGPTLQVRTKRGDVVSIAADDVVVMKTLAAVPVRTADIRNLEHAAALAWPGIEQEWIDGWLLRFGHGVTHRANSTVPIGIEASGSALPAIIDWYASRGVTPWLSVPDRLFRLHEIDPHLETVVMVRDVPSDEPDAAVSLSAVPDAEWLRLYERDVPVDVLTAVVGGEVIFASIADTAVGRAAVTDGPDGGRWVGLSAVRVAEAARRGGHARKLCSAALAWGSQRGATRAYVQVLADNDAGIGLYESMGFVVQHRSRYVDARSL